MIRFSIYIVIFILLSKIVVLATTNFVTKFCPILPISQVKLGLCLGIFNKNQHKNNQIVIHFIFFAILCATKKKINKMMTMSLLSPLSPRGSSGFCKNIGKWKWRSPCC